MKAVLGVKTGEGHDSGAALVYERANELACVALSQERLSRVKNDNRFPQSAIEACLDHAGVRADAIDAVVLDKLGPHTPVDTLQPTLDFSSEVFTEEEQQLLTNTSQAHTAVVNHHLAHAASAFATTDFNSAAVLIIDGSGTRYPREKSHPGLIAMGPVDTPNDFPIEHYDRSAETQTIYHAERDTKNRPHYTRVATSKRSGLGHFYTFFSRHVLGFAPFQEGKAMGLAAYGNPDAIGQFPCIEREWFESIDTPILEYCLKIGFRPPRRPNDADPLASQYADLALWLQTVLTRGHEHLSRLALQETRSRNLCAAGGVALNVVANKETHDALAPEGMLDAMYVQPAASDTGTPLGAALIGYSEIIGGTLPFQRDHVYLGPAHYEAQAERICVAHGGVLTEDPIQAATDLLLEGKILGWWDGRSEHGPRALGARSILCWPRPHWMKDHLNARVKRREPFRPFAPIAPVEYASTIFDGKLPSPYMLFNATVRDEYRDKLPAVTHTDGSARLQTVDSNDLPKLHKLLLAIRERDGVGVLLNTSFNVAGEPIVESPEDALRCYASTNIDALIIGRAVVQKSTR